MALKPVKTVNGNGEIEVGLVDDEVTASDLAGPAEKSLSGFNLRPEIMKRAGEVYKEDAINNKDRPKNGLLDLLTPRQGTQKGGGGKGRSSGTILDPYNLGMFGGREAVIDKIIREGGQELIKSYNPETGKYSKLPQWNRSMDGVIDDDITKGLVLRQATQRKDTPEWRALTPEQQKNVGTLTPTSDIIKGAAADTEYKNTKERIQNMDQGQTLLDDYTKIELGGEAPTLQQLNMLETHVKQLQPGELRKAEDHRQSSETQASTIQINKDQLQLNKDIEANRHSVAKRTATTEEGTLSLAQTNANNALTQQEFENEDKVAYRNYQAQEAEKLRAFTATENAAQRATQMEINLLGREDSREERAYDRRRDERQDRQMMIMQMMKGLQQLGGSFSI